MSTSTHETSPLRRGTSRWLAVPVAVGMLALGTWFFGGVVAPGYLTSIIFSIGWFVVAAGLAWAATRRWPTLARPLGTTFAVAAVLGGAGFYWTSIRDDRVNEAVVTGVAPAAVPAPTPAASEPTSPPAQAPVNVAARRGSFVARAHAGRGTATVVELAAGGQRLTLTDFETDNGPDLYVYLTRGSVGGGVDDFVNLGRLKGNVGNQQYVIPEGTDLDAYSTVVVWCRAFSVNFAEATLRPV